MVDQGLPEALAKNWFWGASGGQQGPLELREVANLVRSWKIDRDTLVWHPSMADWRRAAEVPELKEFLQDQSPPPLPPETSREGAIPPPLPTVQGASSAISVQDYARASDEQDDPLSQVPAEDATAGQDGLPWPSARRARAALLTMMLLSVLSIMATYGQIQILNEAAAGAAVDPQRAEASDQGVAIISLIWFVSYLLTAVVFVGWLRQVYDAAYRIDPESLRYGKKWTVWGWVIPIGFLYIPYRVVKDAWNVLSPAEDEYDWPNLLGWWWLMWIMTNALAWFSLRGASAESIASLQVTSWASLLSDAAALAAAAFAVKIVTQLTKAAANARVGHAV